MTVTGEYLLGVLTRASTGWPDDGHKPEWDARPRPRKLYDTSACVPIDDLVHDDDRAVRAALDAALRAYAYRDRRVDVTPNDREGRAFRVAQPVYGRATVAGGGLYPLELYLCTQGTTTLPAGAYHVDWALRRLVPVSLGPDSSHQGHQLVVTVRYWANSFKYGEFCYHVVGMDVGSFLATFDLVAGDDLPRTTELTGDGTGWRRALGLDASTEDVYAVVHLGSPGEPPRRAASAAQVATGRPGRAFARTAAVVAEHMATATGSRTWARPAPEVADVERVLDARHTCFGRFTDEAVDLEEMTVLARDTLGLADPLAEAFGVPPVELHAVLRNVTGAGAGVHRYSRSTGAWVRSGPEVADAELQSVYFLDNYDMGRVAAVIVPVVRPQPAAEDLASNAYRALNALVGALAQDVYVLATRAGLGCGAILGFDNQRFGGWLLEHPPRTLADPWPYLMLAVGRERTPSHSFRARLMVEDAW